MTKYYLLLLPILLLFTCGTPKPLLQKAGEPRPNIILIVADDLGYYDLGCYGGEFIETPNLDRLAAAGLRFTDGYAAAPLCSPTRASIQSGTAPARIGMTEHIRGYPKTQPWMKVVPVRSAQRLEPSYDILPELLGRAGYTTAHIGKWHLGNNESLPAAMGYDFSFAGNWAGLPRTFFYPFFDPGMMADLEAYSKPGDYLTDKLTDRALDYIGDKRDSTFFLHLAYYSPHVPIEGKEEWVAKYHQKRQPLPDSLLPNVHYAAMVSSIDENVGRVVQRVRDLKLAERTLIIFTSDNGGLSVREVPGYDKHTPPTDNGILKEGKGYLSEGGIREPFIFSWPGHVQAGRTNATPVISTDFYNTFAALAGRPERTADGQSLVPLLAGRTIPARDLYWHHPHYSPQRGKPEAAIRSGDYKLVYHYEEEVTTLYNLKTDPGEENDLATERPELARELLAKLLAWQQRVGAKLPERNADYGGE